MFLRMAWGLIQMSQVVVVVSTAVVRIRAGTCGPQDRDLTISKVRDVGKELPLKDMTACRDLCDLLLSRSAHSCRKH